MAHSLFNGRMPSEVRDYFKAVAWRRSTLATAAMIMAFLGVWKNVLAFPVPYWMAGALVVLFLAVAAFMAGRGERRKKQTSDASLIFASAQATRIHADHGHCYSLKFWIGNTSPVTFTKVTLAAYDENATGPVCRESLPDSRTVGPGGEIEFVLPIKRISNGEPRVFVWEVHCILKGKNEKTCFCFGWDGQATNFIQLDMLRQDVIRGLHADCFA